jgi:hypothetical protein
MAGPAAHGGTASLQIQEWLLAARCLNSLPYQRIRCRQAVQSADIRPGACDGEVGPNVNGRLDDPVRKLRSRRLHDRTTQQAREPVRRFFRDLLHITHIRLRGPRVQTLDFRPGCEQVASRTQRFFQCFARLRAHHDE